MAALADYAAVTAAFSERFSAQAHEFRGEVTLLLPVEHNVEAARALRDEFGYEMLIDITAIDYWPQAPERFHLNYQFYSISQNCLLRLRMPLQGNAPSVRTVETIYPGVNWYEREVYDLFGVKFEGHSDLRRIVLPYEWEGHPLRKDYPLGYEEVQFTFNADEIRVRKPQPKA
jgi:NADH-quinone oxidoreductase subunit C